MGLPLSVQNTRAWPLMPAAARRSSQSCKDGPRPGVQAHHAVMVPFAVQDADRAGLGVQVFRGEAKASLIRKPARYRTTIKARLRMPVAARLEQARIRAFTSSGDERFGRQLAALVGGNVAESWWRASKLRFRLTEASLYCHIACRSGRSQAEANCFEKMGSGCLHAFRAGDGLKAGWGHKHFRCPVRGAGRPVLTTCQPHGSHRRDCPCSTAFRLCSPAFRTESASPTAVLLRRRSTGASSACSCPAPSLVGETCRRCWKPCRWSCRLSAVWRCHRSTGPDRFFDCWIVGKSNCAMIAATGQGCRCQDSGRSAGTSTLC